MLVPSVLTMLFFALVKFLYPRYNIMIDAAAPNKNVTMSMVSSILTVGQVAVYFV